MVHYTLPPPPPIPMESGGTYMYYARSHALPEPFYLGMLGEKIKPLYISGWGLPLAITGIYREIFPRLRLPPPPKKKKKKKKKKSPRKWEHNILPPVGEVGAKD